MTSDLRFKVRGFSALNARMHIEGKRNAMDAQSAKPFLVLPAVVRTRCRINPNQSSVSIRRLGRSYFLEPRPSEPCGLPGAARVADSLRGEQQKCRLYRLGV